MRIELETRTRTLRIYNDAEFESKHPRGKDGRFSTSGIAAHVDFHEIPPDVSKTLTDTIQSNIQKYPFMQGHFSFIGSSRAKLARDLGDNIDANENVQAFYKPEPLGGRGRICFSGIDLALTKLRPDNSRYHPVGTNSPKGIADHEFGHALWYRLGLNKDSATTSQLKQYIADYMKSHSPEEIKQNLSHYANTGPGEFFAEAFSELQNNPRPRLLAKKIGELLDAEIKSQKLDTNK